MSWVLAGRLTRCDGLDCPHEIQAGEPLRLVAGGRVRWCVACAATKLQEAPPETIAPAPASPLDVREHFARFRPPVLPLPKPGGRR